MSNKAKSTTKKPDGKPALTPKLRFPEFRNAAGWKYVPLGKLLMRSPDYGVNAAAVPFSERLPKYLRITDISDDGTYLSDKKVSVDLEPTDEIYLDEGDIVLARTGASVGKSYRYRKEDGRLVFAGFLIRVKPDKTKLVSGYLANFLTTVQYWDWVAVNSARSGQPGINSTEYSSLAIPLPPDDLAEQQKIANCLSSVDELIAAQARKVDALKTHKKWLIQQLFPREGETIPRLRFPEFASTSAWYSQKVASLLSKASFAVSVEPENMYREIGIRSHGKGIFHKEPVRGKVIGDKRVFHVVQDALVLNIVFAWEQAVATTSKNEVGMIASHRFPMYVAKPGKCDVGYVKEFFLTKVGKQLLGVASPGGAGRNKTLGQKEFESLKIALPIAVGEQTRIANCLSSLDTVVAVESEKLDALKSHKKGLMQQLFPLSAEV